MKRIFRTFGNFGKVDLSKARHFDAYPRTGRLMNLAGNTRAAVAVWVVICWTLWTPWTGWTQSAPPMPVATNTNHLTGTNRPAAVLAAIAARGTNAPTTNGGAGWRYTMATNAQWPVELILVFTTTNDISQGYMNANWRISKIINATNTSGKVCVPTNGSGNAIMGVFQGRKN